MAKADVSFNFGFNATKGAKGTKATKGKGKGGGSKSGKKSDAWKAYTGGK